MVQIKKRLLSLILPVMKFQRGKPQRRRLQQIIFRKQVEYFQRRRFFDTQMFPNLVPLFHQRRLRRQRHRSGEKLVRPVIEFGQQPLFPCGQHSRRHRFQVGITDQIEQGQFLRILCRLDKFLDQMGITQVPQKSNPRHHQMRTDQKQDGLQLRIAKSQTDETGPRLVDAGLRMIRGPQSLAGIMEQQGPQQQFGLCQLPIRLGKLACGLMPQGPDFADRLQGVDVDCIMMIRIARGKVGQMGQLRKPAGEPTHLVHRQQCLAQTGRILKEPAPKSDRLFVLPIRSGDSLCQRA